MRYRFFQFVLLGLLGASFAFLGIHFCCCDAGDPPEAESRAGGGACCPEKDPCENPPPGPCKMVGVFASIPGPTGGDLSVGSQEFPVFQGALPAVGLTGVVSELTVPCCMARASPGGLVPIILLKSSLLL